MERRSGKILAALSILAALAAIGPTTPAMAQLYPDITWDPNNEPIFLHTTDPLARTWSWSPPAPWA